MNKMKLGSVRNRTPQKASSDLRPVVAAEKAASAAMTSPRTADEIRASVPSLSAFPEHLQPAEAIADQRPGDGAQMKTLPLTAAVLHVAEQHAFTNGIVAA